MKSGQNNRSEGSLAGVHPLEERLTLEESAYKELRRVITDGVLGPGERIPINAIAHRLGVSRLPVIHALRRLASEGFVQIRPHRSPIVTQPSPKEIRVRILMMIALEEIAVREAWPLAPEAQARLEALHERCRQQMEAGVSDEETDWRFHQVIWQASGVDHLIDAIQTLWDLGAYYRSSYIRMYGIVQYRAAEHDAIRRAFYESTPEAAVECIRTHRLHALQRLNELFGEAVIAATP